MSNTTRQPGYYRVKYKGQWDIALYGKGPNKGDWELFSEVERFNCLDEDFDEIDPTPIDPNPAPHDDQKGFIRGAACAVATIISGHGYGTECKEAFKACVGSWDNFLSAEPDPYDIDILSPHFNSKHNEQ